jgi:hypothetical protein
VLLEELEELEEEDEEEAGDAANICGGGRWWCLAGHSGRVYIPVPRK